MSGLSDSLARQDADNTSCALSRFFQLVVMIIIGLMLGLLLVNRATAQSCTPAPSGLLSWWRAEGDGSDYFGVNNGSLAGNTTFGSGLVGQCFVFDGQTSGVQLGAAPGLQLQNFTIEAWVQRSSTLQTTLYQTGVGFILAYGIGGYGFAIVNGGQLMLTKVGVDSVFSSVFVRDTKPHHVAVTKNGTSVIFYVDGVAYAAGTYSSTFSFSTDAAIGAQGDDLTSGFLGSVDELGVYSRALSSAEIQAIYKATFAGKCISGAPVITVPPTNQTAIASATVDFVVSATGTWPLSFQWTFNGIALAGQTNATLVLTNVQTSQSGPYAVIVSNSIAPVTSGDAYLNVNPVSCTPAPDGMISWWPGEGNALDEVSTNHGSLVGNVSYGKGKVGTGFVFSGGSGAVLIGNPNSLQIQDFTIEAWVKRPTIGGVQIIFGYGLGGYGFALAGGQLMLTKVGVSGITSTAAMTDTNYHHVAVTKTGTAVRFYLDGVGEDATSPYDPGFSFTTVAAIGANANDMSSIFAGTIDEISIYNRALSDSEVQAIYSADFGGKCAPPVPPSWVLQLTNVTVVAGNSTTLAVLAAGALPITYQWAFNGAPLVDATGTTLALSDIQVSQAGTYTCQASNDFGNLTTTNVLTVTPRPPCVSLAGLISWWAAEDSAVDWVGGNNGGLSNGVTFVPGISGQAFSFNGSSQYVQISNNPSLNPGSGVTLEGWVNFPYFSGNTMAVVSKDGESSNRQLLLQVLGSPTRPLFRAAVGVPGQFAVLTSAQVLPTNTWIHVAVTHDGSVLQLYINGILDTNMPAAGRMISTTQPLRLGRGGPSGSYFAGQLDEVGLFARALSPAEILSIYTAGAGGKCTGVYAPFIFGQPANQTVTIRSNATLFVTSAGTVPFTYQWNFNGAPIAGATNSSLTITNAQFKDAGSYQVAVTNSAGGVLSSNALLTLAYPSAIIMMSGTSAPAASTFTIPISIAANGNESALGLSLSYDATKLAFVAANAGAGAQGAVVRSNTSLTNNGKVGLELAMQPGTLINSGTQQVVQVVFSATVLTNATSTVAFADSPTLRQLLDANLGVLSANYGASASVTIIAADLEGDVFPRPSGDKSVGFADWLQMGRYVARLDYPTNAAEFQRADCAPRATLGDGAIKVTDWVQVGRYDAGWDIPTAAGGPTNEIVGAGAGPSITRILTSGATNMTQGNAFSISLTLAAQGNENALGCSLSFDPSQVRFNGAVLGSDSAGATMYVNVAQVSSGKIGLALALGTGSGFSPGNRELVRLNFTAQANGSFSPSFADNPVPREISDPAAAALAVSYANATILPSVQPSLRIAPSGTHMVLAWPSWASNYVLQHASGNIPPPGVWTNLLAAPVDNGNELQIAVPIAPGANFYRLSTP